MFLEKRQFFQAQAEQGIALTYDDVRVGTGPSQASATEVDITGRFSTNIDLKVPIVSAAMDTVTESGMAIAMAKLGGIGVIHAGLDIQDQRDEVRRTKLHLNGRIEKPITVRAGESIARVLEECDERGFDFRTFPVIDDDGKFVGLLTQNDFKFANGDSTRPVAEAMTPASQVTVGRHSTATEEAYSIMRREKKGTLPIISEDGTVAGLYLLSDVERLVKGNPQRYNLDENGRLRVAAAVPTNDEALERVRVMEKYLDAVVIDTAQGDSKYAIATLKKLREEFPNIDIVIGNISSPRSVELLIGNGADGIKIGQGPGSICTTRAETGIGMPQVSAVYECAKVAREEMNSNIPICADGGITERGDISIAIAAGADSVMLGSKLAGTDEAPGEVIRREDGKRFKRYRGMGSASALRDSAASRARYDADQKNGVLLPEGVESEVPYSGSVVNEVNLMVQALRKSLSYCGAPNLYHHQEFTPLVRITNAGLRESHPHDVAVV